MFIFPAPPTFPIQEIDMQTCWSINLAVHLLVWNVFLFLRVTGLILILWGQLAGLLLGGTSSSLSLGPRSALRTWNTRLCLQSTLSTVWAASHPVEGNCFATLPEKAMAPHSSVLAWKIPWAEEPGRLQSMGLHRVGRDWSNLAAAAALMNLPQVWQLKQHKCSFSSGGQKSDAGPTGLKSRCQWGSVSSGASREESVSLWKY